MSQFLPDSSGSPLEHEVVVIGAGQAGLAAGYYLQQAGVDVRILEAAETVGAGWARRWNSLRLFTPARYDALPGMGFPADPWHYPFKDEVAGYLTAYAARFGLPVRLNTAVMSMRQEAGGGFVLDLGADRMLRAAAVVVATGAFGVPFTPAFAQNLDPEVVQVHTDAYRAPQQLPEGTVAVVGGGNSGTQIALELARAGREVHLAERTRSRHLPQRVARRLVTELTHPAPVDRDHHRAASG